MYASLPQTRTGQGKILYFEEFTFRRFQLQAVFPFSAATPERVAGFFAYLYFSIMFTEKIKILLYHLLHQFLNMGPELKKIFVCPFPTQHFRIAKLSYYILLSVENGQKCRHVDVLSHTSGNTVYHLS